MAAAQLKSVLRKIVPSPVWEGLKRSRERISPLRMAPPVLQIYIDDGQTNSYLGINNFYSFLAASVSTDALLEIEFLDQEGRRICCLSEKLGNLQSKFVNVSDLLSARGISSPLGSVLVQLKPAKSRLSVYKRLGMGAAHFFVFYKDLSGGVSMIHPSSFADPENRPSGAYISNQVITTAGLKQVVLYQCNPCRTPHRITHSLRNMENGEVVAEIASDIPAMGVRRIEFCIDEIADVPARLQMALDALPSANSKPMLRRVYANDQYSMSHS